MPNKLKPGENSGSDGGIYQEVGKRGGKIENFATIPDVLKRLQRKNRVILGNR